MADTDGVTTADDTSNLLLLQSQRRSWGTSPAPTETEVQNLPHQG